MTGKTASDEATFLSDVLRSEAEAITRLALRISQDSPESQHFVKAIDLICECKGHVVVSGMGKSGLIGTKLSATFASLGQPSHFVHPAEAVHGDLGRIRTDDVVMLLSYSGETEELLNFAAILNADGVPRIGISKHAQTSLAKISSVHISLGDIEEACPLNLAPTATTATMLAAGDALALAVARRRNFKADDFHKIHPGGMLGIGLRPVSEALRFQVGKNLTCVPLESTMKGALQSAGEGRRAGALMVVDSHGRLAGILTDGDVRRLINKFGAAALDKPIADCMTKHPRCLPAQSLVRDAVRMIRELRVDELPVVDTDGRPIGLIDVQDLVALKVVRD
ncbi:MAG: KpsF/GutQ family sugar-phosphate isomerase [Planctomycetes bacterium]|nr:KpsF/GutQ family sugar-phosphate isomerase [Planctomycetota bacterium]